MLEKLIETIAALVLAINANTAALKSAPSTVAATGETAAQKKAREKAEAAAAGGATTPGVPEVRAAATSYLDAQKDQAAQTKFMSELNGKYGTKRISEAAPDKFPEIIAILNAEIARIKAPATPPPSANDSI